MKLFDKDILGVNYKVYYKYTKQLGKVKDYHVEIIKTKISKPQNVSCSNLLTNMQLKTYIENELCNPIF